MGQPPIIPGAGEPYALSSLMPQPAPPRHQNRWLVPALAATAILGVAAAVFFALNGPDRLRGAVTPERPTPTSISPLRQANISCGSVGELGDGDRTLNLDGQGREAGSGDVAITSTMCILGQLKTPDFVIRQMEQTRALDGQLRATWAGYEAVWTYHPDEGLNLVIHQVG